MTFTYYKDKNYPSVGKWLLINVLGDGATSTVFLGYDLKTKSYSAIKIFKDTDPFTAAQAKKEALLHSSINHRLILQVKEFNSASQLVDLAGNKKSVSFMELELARGGDLLLLLERVKFVPEKLARTYFHQIIEVLEYLHQKKIAHGDIKPENLMLDSNFCIKLADFGSASKLTSNSFQVSEAGTTKYFPPERYQERNYDGASADIFAAAIVLFCLVCGQMPFSKAVRTDYLYYLISNGKVDLFWMAHQEIAEKRRIHINPSPEFKDLLAGLMDPDPKRRYSIDNIKKSPWYQCSIYEPTEVMQLVQKMID